MTTSACSLQFKFVVNEAPALNDVLSFSVITVINYLRQIRYSYLHLTYFNFPLLFFIYYYLINDFFFFFFVAFVFS